MYRVYQVLKNGKHKVTVKKYLTVKGAESQKDHLQSIYPERIYNVGYDEGVTHTSL